jgi:NADH:ubiquinone oxidoreductase subunit H
LLSPFLVFFISMISWLFIPLSWYGSLSTSEFNFLWIILLSSFNTYSIFLSGWSSNCKYALLGSVRSIVQMISFEISISLLLLPIFFLNGSFNLLSIVSYQSFVNFFNFSWSLPNFLLIFVCILIETNRAPFDLPEAEAELVAGYNVEYSSIPFAFFFLGEYLNIFIMCVILNTIFFKGWFTNFFFFESFFYFLNILLIMIIIIWFRSTLPRARYDLLLTFCWKYSLLYSGGFWSFFIIFYHFLIFFKLFI